MTDSLNNAGFVAPATDELAPLFPGYDFQGLIATGGMGAVYSAVQRSLDRTVAIKILPMELSKDAAFCAGFEAEAKAMARLNHPNLIGVYDFGEVNGMLYIVMEFVAGQSMYHSAYGTAVDPREVIRLVTGVCNGLAHAHEHGIIHRDIKPSNILLDLNGQPKIGDFGLARPVERKIEEGEEIFGTPHYTAPEVVNAPLTVDHRADIFSVGVLLHELLTGKLPETDPRPASTIVRCDTRFDAIIRRATQNLPANRYSSAKEIAGDLQAIAASLAPKGPRAGANGGGRPATKAAPRAAVPGRGRRPVVVKKSSGSPAGFMLMVVAAAVAAAYFYHSKSQTAKPVPTREVIQIIQKSADPEDPAVDSGGPDPAVTPAPVAPKTSATPFGSSTNSAVTPASSHDVAPGPPAAVKPKSDVPAFFARARKAMQDKAKTAVSVYHSSLNSNITDFERALKRQIPKLNSGEAAATKAVEAAVGEWQAAGGRIAEKLDKDLGEIPDVETHHAAALQAQTGCDDLFLQGLLPLSRTYIQGLELQIDRLKADNDVGAITLIKAEIEKTKNSTTYFANLVTGGKFGDE